MLRSVPTFCNICRACCGLIAHVENEKIVRIKGDPKNPQSLGGACIKGLNAHRTVYASDRLTKPLLRKKTDQKFQESSWDEVLNFVAEHLCMIKDKYGPESIGIYQGTSSRFLATAFSNALSRLIGTPNLSGTWSLCVGPKMLGYTSVYGPPPFAWCDFRNAKLIVLIGTNPYASRLQRYYRIVDDILYAKSKGAKLVVIDPRPHRMAQKADRHLAINPGTDLFLLLALIKTILETDSYNRNFVRKYVTGFEELDKTVREMDINDLVKHTGLEMSAVKELAMDLGEFNPVSIDRREGMIHTTNATAANQAMAILQTITGSVDIPGGLTFNSPLSLDASLGIKAPPLSPPFWKEDFPLAMDASGMFPNAILNQKPHSIKALICQGGNPVSVFPNTRKTMAALSSLELMVCCDLFMTESARIAHVVLPSAHFLEKGDIDIGPFKKGKWLKISRPIIKPQGETWPEWRIFSELSWRMGYSEPRAFKDSDEIIKDILAKSGLNELDLEKLVQGCMLAPLVHGERLDKGFKTSSGKIELDSSLFKKNVFPSIPLPQDSCQCTQDYPYRLITGARITAFCHSQQRNIPQLAKTHPEPKVEIPPEIAKAEQLKEGQIATVATPLGKVQLSCTIVKGMNPITISIPHGWPGKQNANLLIDDNLYDPAAATPAYKAVQCAIRRA